MGHENNGSLHWNTARRHYGHVFKPLCVQRCSAAFLTNDRRMRRPRPRPRVLCFFPSPVQTRKGFRTDHACGYVSFRTIASLVKRGDIYIDAYNAMCCDVHMYENGFLVCYKTEVEEVEDEFEDSM